MNKGSSLLLRCHFEGCESSTLERVETAHSAQHARYLEGPDETRVSLPRCRWD